MSNPNEEDPSGGSGDTETVTAVNGESAAAPALPGADVVAEPPAKKKRTADRQITKDDDGDSEGEDDEGGGGAIGIGFKKASAEVLSRRRILKVRRPGAPHAVTASTEVSAPVARSNPFAATRLVPTTNGTDDTASSATANAPADAPADAAVDAPVEESKPRSNPFANIVLTVTPAAATTIDSDTHAVGTTATTKPKVFGSSSAFAGFTMASASGGGFGGFGTGTAATAASTGFGSSTVSGFGSSSAFFASASHTSSSSSPDKASANSEPSQTTTASTSLFQTAMPGGITFGFGSKSDATGDAAASGDGEDAAASGPTLAVPAVVLPTNVELTTGEEDEERIHEVRCKSFNWVLDVENEDPAESSNGMVSSSSMAKANSSFNPSTDLHPATETSPGKVQATTTEKEGKGSEKNGDNGAPENGSKERDDAQSEKGTKYRWQELGTGPMKILRSLSQPDRYRVVQRRESTQNGPATKVILNAKIYKESSCTRPAPKYLTLNTPGVDGKAETYSLRFKESSEATFFEHYITESIANAKSVFAPSSGTDTVE